MNRTLFLLAPFALSLACAGNEAARAEQKPVAPTVGKKEAKPAPRMEAKTPDPDKLMLATRPVYFAFDSAELTEDGAAALREAGKWLQRHPGAALVLEGHADQRGSEEYNLALGQRRADTMREYLLRLGVNERQLKSVTYGAHRPAVAGAGERAWSKNRRGELVLKAAS